MKSKRSEDLVRSIQKGEWDDDLGEINKQLCLRMRQIQKEKTFAAVLLFVPGDKVRLEHLRPAFMDGLTGTVKSKRNTRLAIELDPESLKTYKAYRPHTISSELQVPASCCVKV